MSTKKVVCRRSTHVYSCSINSVHSFALSQIKGRLVHSITKSIGRVNGLGDGFFVQF